MKWLHNFIFPYLKNVFTLIRSSLLFVSRKLGYYSSMFFLPQPTLPASLYIMLYTSHPWILSPPPLCIYINSAWSRDKQDSLTKYAATDADSPGRSGARFLLSSDQKLIIKTIGTEEVAEMHRILKEYHQV